MDKIDEIRKEAEKSPKLIWKEVDFSSGKGGGDLKIDGIMNAGASKFYYKARQDIPNLCDALEVANNALDEAADKFFRGDNDVDKTIRIKQAKIKSILEKGKNGKE